MTKTEQYLLAGRDWFSPGDSFTMTSKRNGPQSFVIDRLVKHTTDGGRETSYWACLGNCYVCGVEFEQGVRRSENPQAVRTCKSHRKAFSTWGHLKPGAKAVGRKDYTPPKKAKKPKKARKVAEPPKKAADPYLEKAQARWARTDENRLERREKRRADRRAEA